MATGILRMSVRYYRLLPACRRKRLVARRGAGSEAERGAARRRGSEAPSRSEGRNPSRHRSPASNPEEIDTESEDLDRARPRQTARPRRNLGPPVGDEVSPSLWNATHDALSFVQIASEDPTDRLRPDRLVFAGRQVERAAADSTSHSVARVARQLAACTGRTRGSARPRPMGAGPDRAGCRSRNWKTRSCCGHGKSTPERRSREAHEQLAKRC